MKAADVTAAISAFREFSDSQPCGLCGKPGPCKKLFVRLSGGGGKCCDECAASLPDLEEIVE